MAFAPRSEMSWLQSYFKTLPDAIKNEDRYKDAAHFLLQKIAADINPECELPGGLRADFSAVLPNGHWIVLECKNLENTATAHVDAVMQAASYADAIEQPVFIGPLDGSCSTFLNGSPNDGMTILHLMAGRLNVGFMGVNSRGEVQLVLRGQVLCSSRTGLHSKFESHWGYVQRVGSKQVKK